MPSAPPVLSVSTDGVTTLTINRPQVRNAVDHAAMLALTEAVHAAANDDATRVLVITGADGAFSSGADISAALRTAITPDEAHRVLTEAYAPAIRAVHEFPYPTIAAVDGMAAGIGCDLALACDIRLVSERGAFAELFIRVGLIPDGGGTYWLPRLVGVGRALEMMFTGEAVSAVDAVQYGLANKLLPTAGFSEAVQAYAARLAQQAPMALRLGKQAMLAALHDSHYRAAMTREAAYQRDILNSPDGFEGFRAFLEKRAPKWQAK
jgi:2-(1,2-epoxy-1,2-dihydrophenyl)acetyl-CoA isomerase